MGSLAGSGDDHSESAVGGAGGEFEGLIGCLVSRQHSHLVLDPEPVEHRGRFLHHRTVRPGAHDDRYAWWHGGTLASGAVRAVGLAAVEADVRAVLDARPADPLHGGVYALTGVGHRVAESH